ncbi:MAG: hypothetical protein RUDDFDWM_000256 [Candidatus Fervidibacterota bacterium]
MPRMLRISILLGIVFVIFFVGRFVLGKRRTPPQKPKVEFAKVVVASVDIPAHTVITGAMLREERRPPNDVPYGAFSRIDDVINRVAKVDIFAGTPVLRTDVTQPISQEGLGALIPEGYVAIALPIDNEALYRMLRTGDHVKIIASFGGLLSQTIVEDAVVLGVDTQVANVELAVRGQQAQQAGGQAGGQAGQQGTQPTPVRTLILLVSPEEAEKIALVSAQTGVNIEFSLLSARPPIPAPKPQQPPKRPTMAREIHPAVERIAAKGAGIPIEEIDKVLGIRPPTTQLPPPQLPPVDPAQVAATVHSKLLAELAPQVQSTREEQERLRHEIQLIRRALSKPAVDAHLKQMMSEISEQLKELEKRIEEVKSTQQAQATQQQVATERVTFFLGDQMMQIPVGQSTEVLQKRP